MIGKTLNHYKVVAHLGRGGMGEVYVAEDTKLGRKVALKMLPTAVAGDSERRARFEREARAVAALNHPHIVTIYGVEEAEGTHFLAMELVEGQVLTELIPQQGLALSRLLDYGIAMADAVSTAHGKGIVHRDLKPDNVMLGQDGRLKVLDFGLAKLREQDAGEAEEVTSLPTQAVTQEGKILGTVSYMAPEQAEGKPADARSDIFALGVMLYEMATGRRPFRGDTTISTITAIMRDTPESVTDINQNLPRHLGRVIKRCLDKDPERRYQTAQDLRNELEGLKEEIASGSLSVSEVAANVPPVTPQKSNRLLAGLAIVAVVAVAVTMLFQRATPEPAATTSTPSMEISRLTSTGNSREAAISADGRYVVSILDEEGRPGMWVTQVSTGSQVNLLPAEEEVYIFDPVYSPDGEYIYFVRGETGSPISHLYRIPALGGDARLVLEDTEGRPSFSPDGSRFVFYRLDNSTSSQQIVVASVDGGVERVLTEGSPPASFNDPAWSPDGSVIAVPLMTVTDRVNSTVVIIAAEGGEETLLTDADFLNIGEISWLPDGSGLVVEASEDFTTNRLYEVSYPQGAIRRLTNDLNSYHGISFSADGSVLATQLNEGTYHVWAVSLDGESESATPKQITRGRAGFDGNRVDEMPGGEVVYASTRGGLLGIYRISAAGGSPTRLTPDNSLSAEPVMTPDGGHVVFISNRAGPVNIWRMDAEGRNPQKLTSGVIDTNPDVSPDGRWVVYHEVASEKLMRVSIDGGPPEVISQQALENPRVSPDGTRIMGWRWHEEPQRLMVDIIPYRGGDPLQSLEISGSHAMWTPDGEGIAYQATKDDVGNVWVQSLAGGDPVQLTFFQDMHIGAFSYSRDGQSLLLSRGEDSQDIVLIRNYR